LPKKLTIAVAWLSMMS